MTPTHATLFNGDILIAEISRLVLSDNPDSATIAGTLEFTLSSMGLAKQDHPLDDDNNEWETAKIQLALNEDIKKSFSTAFLTSTNASDISLNLKVNISGLKRDLSFLPDRSKNQETEARFDAGQEEAGMQADPAK